MAHFEKAKSLNDWLDQRLAVNTLNKVLATEYWIPKNINFLWAMGMVLAVTFGLLLISGIFLLMYYKPDVNLAFDSVNNIIMNEVGYGDIYTVLQLRLFSLLSISICLLVSTMVHTKEVVR